jgi:hypothetical protein
MLCNTLGIYYYYFHIIYSHSYNIGEIMDL